MPDVELNPIIIKLDGTPQGKSRPRFGKGRAYTAIKTRNYETALQWEAKLAMQGRTMIEGPVQIKIVALMPIPQSWARKKQAAAAIGFVRPTSKPDLDNIYKGIDALNGIVWKDDAQVVKAFVEKKYSADPALWLEISDAG
jgi:Holliday junction resolvase RusA-like endonuclease